MAAHAERHLHIVEADTGRVLDEHPEVQGLRDEVKGLQRALRKECRAHEELRRDKEREARESQLWPQAIRVFRAWQLATGHKKMVFDYKRFALIEPHLKRKDHGPEYCLAAVAGRVFDHFSAQRKNGTTVHYWEWERIFDSIGSLEESARRVPPGWRDREPFPRALEALAPWLGSASAAPRGGTRDGR